jgi:alpha-tubulin suppressor-like RCC1 family protein
MKASKIPSRIWLGAAFWCRLGLVLLICQQSVSVCHAVGGSVVAWGRNNAGQTQVPAGLVNVIAVAGGDAHSLALNADGTVVGWGYNLNGQATPPAGLSNVVAIAAGNSYSMA